MLLVATTTATPAKASNLYRCYWLICESSAKKILLLTAAKPRRVALILSWWLVTPTTTVDVNNQSARLQPQKILPARAGLI